MAKLEKELVLICAIALAAGGEKNVKNIVSKAKALAEELGEEEDGTDGDDDDSETDDDSDSEDDDSDTEDEDEDSDSDESEEEDDETDDEDEDKKPPKKTAKKPAAKTAGKKKFKSKAQSYARDNDTHKEIFSGVLKAVAPQWKKDAASKKRAKDASVKLEGSDFLDAEGEVLASFKQSVKKHMSVKK